MNLRNVRGAVERDDHFEVDDGSGSTFRVAKAALSPALVDRVRKLYCGGKVQQLAAGGFVEPEPELVDDGTSSGVMVDPLAAAEAGGDTGTVIAPVGLEPASDYAAAVARLDAASQARVEPVKAVDSGADVEPPAPVAADAPVVVPGITLTSTGRAAAPVKAAAPVVAGEPVKEGAPVKAGAPVVVAEPGASATAAEPETLFESFAVQPVGALPVVPGAGNLGARLAAGAAALNNPATAPVGVTAEDVTRAGSTLEARRARLESSDKAAVAELALAQQRIAEAEANRVAAEQAAADMVSIGRKHEAMLAAAKVDYTKRAGELRDAESARVEAGRVWSNLDGWGKVLATLSLIVGGAAAGVGRRQNEAAAVVDAAIAADIESQKSEIAARRSNRFQEYQAAGATVQQASQLVQADLQSLTAAKMRAMEARAPTRAARDAFASLAAQLEAKRDAAVAEAVADFTAAATAASIARRGLVREELQTQQLRQTIDLAQRADVRDEARLKVQQQSLGLRSGGGGGGGGGGGYRGGGRRSASAAAGVSEAAAAAVPPEGRAWTSAEISSAGAQGFLLTPAQYGALPPGERGGYVMQNVGGQTVWRATQGSTAAEYNKAAVAYSEAKTALGQITKYLRTDAEGKPRMVRNEQGQMVPADVPSTTWSMAHPAEIRGARKALVGALGRMAQAGALSESEESRFTEQIPDPQGVFTSDAQEATMAQSLSQRLEAAWLTAQQRYLVPPQGVLPARLMPTAPPVQTPTEKPRGRGK